MMTPKAARRLGIAAAIVITLAGGFVAWRLTHAPTARQDRRALYYCPMHPTFTSDRPGTCPICNMSLVKVEEPSLVAGAAHGRHTDTTQSGQWGQSPAGTDPLVAEKMPSGQAPDGARSPSAVAEQSVCYEHNCPMVHDGKPCPMLVVAEPGERVDCPVCGSHVADATATPAKILYWTDPMLPGYRSDKPGKSPMGMDLVPVYEEAAGSPAGASAAPPAGYAPILLTPAKQQLIGVRTATAVRQALTKTIRTVGKVAYDPDLYQAEEEYIQARKAWSRSESSGAAPDVIDQARRLMEASRTRLRLLGLSGQLIDEMEGWEGPDRGLLLSDPGARVWVYAPIYEYELSLANVGNEVVIETASSPGNRWRGVIRAIDSVLDPATRSARVRVQLEDPEGILRPEMYMNASITVALGDVLAVPQEAVFLTGAKAIVFVDKEQGIFEPRDVTVGAQADGLYEIRAGLVEGERVVTSGNFLIDSESRLKGALEGMSGSGGHQHGQ